MQKPCKRPGTKTLLGLSEPINIHILLLQSPGSNRFTWYVGENNVQSYMKVRFRSLVCATHAQRHNKAERISHFCNKDFRMNSPITPRSASFISSKLLITLYQKLRACKYSRIPWYINYNRHMKILRIYFNIHSVTKSEWCPFSGHILCYIYKFISKDYIKSSLFGFSKILSNKYLIITYRFLILTIFAVNSAVWFGIHCSRVW